MRTCVQCETHRFLWCATHRTFYRLRRSYQAAGARADAAGLKSRLEDLHTLHLAQVERLKVDSESSRAKFEASAVKVRSSLLRTREICYSKPAQMLAARLL